MSTHDEKPVREGEIPSKEQVPQEDDESPGAEYSALVNYIQNVELRKGDDEAQEEDDVTYKRVSFLGFT